MPRRRKSRVLIVARAQVRETRLAVIGPAEPITNETSVIRQTATGQAFMAVAQSAALAAETGSAYLRSITMVGQATMDLAMVKMAESPETNIAIYSPLIAQVTHMLSSAVQSYTKISTAAGEIVQKFPSS